MKKYIGLLGGSFNPAHDGHLYISNQALNLLELDEIWWVVASQNPLKSKSDMMDFNDRFNGAKILTKDNDKIKISDFERQYNTQYTIDTILKIKQKYLDYQFIWLMGADNLMSFHKWHDWKNILNNIAIAVFDRNFLKDSIMESEMGKQYSKEYMKDFKKLKNANIPAWSFLKIENHLTSSTIIRKYIKETKEYD